MWSRSAGLAIRTSAMLLFGWEMWRLTFHDLIGLGSERRCVTVHNIPVPMWRERANTYSLARTCGASIVSYRVHGEQHEVAFDFNCSKLGRHETVCTCKASCTATIFPRMIYQSSENETMFQFRIALDDDEPTHAQWHLVIKWWAYVCWHLEYDWCWQIVVKQWLYDPFRLCMRYSSSERIGVYANQADILLASVCSHYADFFFFKNAHSNTHTHKHKQRAALFAMWLA